jgi:hypothetical protein
MTTKHPLPTNVVLETLPLEVKEGFVSLEYRKLKNVRPEHVHTGITKEGIEIVGVGRTADESLAALERNLFRQKRIGR